ncbi:hypothetical protein ACFQS2_06895 [Brachybacterium sp. GCM10030267]|uniref:hypothetical protein n=1 Tax=unclassified Brachybacterium TaxID=2623841 RepID=UPI0036216467
MELLVPILFAFVFVAIVAAAVLLMTRGRRRESALLQDSDTALHDLAERWGWTYEAEETGFADRFTGFPFSQTARGRISREMLHGSFRGRQAVCLLYVPTPMTVGERRTYRRHYRVFTLQLAREVATLQVTPTARDVRPRGDDALAQRVLSAEVRTAVRERGLPIRFEGDVLMTWFEQKHSFGPAEVEAGFAYLDEIADLLPEELGGTHCRPG